jgi:hypothetical protein
MSDLLKPSIRMDIKPDKPLDGMDVEALGIECYTGKND